MSGTRATARSALLTLLALSAIGASGAAADDAQRPAGGDDLPPVGRSLFDELVRGADGAPDVPWPFPALLQRIRERGGLQEPALRRALIPLGRSLQRNGASPDYFRFPRAIVAVDGERDDTADVLLLKDRLFIGYQERANALEVISYNETAGRFEFQLVRGYAAGSTPQVFYTSRAVCTRCHQGATPIFSRTPWDETNANPLVAELLRRERESFHGIPAAASLDEPNGIDDATDRASRLVTWQRLWREGCAATSDAARCRAQTWLALLRFRLSGSRPPSQTAAAGDAPAWRAVAQAWRSAWAAAFPEGLAFPDPNLPNRDPLRGPRPSTGVPASHDDFAGAPELDRSALLAASAVDPVFEPLLRRPPLEVWTAANADDARLEQALAGLAGWLARADVRALDHALFERATAPGAPAARRYTGTCRIERRTAAGAEATLSLECANDDGLALRGSLRERSLGGALEQLALPGRGRLWNLALAPESRRLGSHALQLALREPGADLHARLADGCAIERVELSWQDAPDASGGLRGELVVHVLDDFAPVAVAVEALRAQSGADGLLGAGPYRPEALARALLTALGAPRASAPPTGAELPPARYAEP